MPTLIVCVCAEADAEAETEADDAGAEVTNELCAAIGVLNSAATTTKDVAKSPIAPLRESTAAQNVEIVNKQQRVSRQKGTSLYTSKEG